MPCDLTTISKLCEYRIPMGRIIILISFFALAPLTVFSITLFLLYMLYQNSENISYSLSPSTKSVAYASLPSLALISEEIMQDDARIEIVRQFFARYKSPLEPHASDIVKSADTYGIDFRLLPAIAMQESNLCKKAPTDSHNCWGFGIYNKKIRSFASYDEAIETISSTLGGKYKNLGLDSPEEIMTRYTPGSNGSWAAGVSHFMDQLQ